ncbi:Omp28-related outer membrane protein [Patiriisocius marinus]|uniref:Omp28-related outer membrane protein n=1 Tax=Patiriisocius marinus TaxID=1397112 RepID=UPI00232B12A7|nr:Omp28-related outer membrane protein [Patiriisocius marinus]
MKNLKLLVSIGLIVLLTVSISCKTDDTIYIINDTAKLELEFNKGLRGQEISLSLEGSNGENFSEEATFYINGSMIESSVFSSQNIGSYEVFAEYNLAGTITQTPTQNIEIIIPKNKIFLDMVLDRSHGQSPKINSYLKEAKTYSSNIINICWITTRINPDDIDPLTTIEAGYMNNNLGNPSFPSAYINRDGWFSVNNIEDLVTEADGIDSSCTVGISSILNNQSLTIEINVVAEIDMFEYKLVVYLIEDNVIGPQKNSLNNNEASEWFGKGDPIPNFQYNNLYRKSVSNFLGDYMEFTPALTAFTKEFEIDIPNNYNTENLKVLAYITNGEDFIPINSQIANINTKVAFE